MFIVIRKKNNKLLYIVNYKSIFSFFKFFGVRSLISIFNIHNKINITKEVFYYKKNISIEQEKILFLFNNPQDAYDKKKYLLVFNKLKKKVVSKVAFEYPFKIFLKNESEASKIFFSNTRNTNIFIYKSFLKKRGGYYKTDSLYINKHFTYQISKNFDKSKLIDILCKLYANNYSIKKMEIDIPIEYQTAKINNLLNKHHHIVTYSHGDFISWNIKKFVFINQYVVSDYEFAAERSLTYDYFYFYTARFVWKKNKNKILDFIRKTNEIKLCNICLSHGDVKKYYIIFLIEFFVFFDQHSHIMRAKEYDIFIFDLVGLLFNER